MTDDIEIQVRRQAQLDAEIERSINRNKRRRRILVVGLSIVIAAVVLIFLVAIAKKITTPTAGVDDYFATGVALREQGDLRGAVGNLRQVLTLNPDHGEARWVLGITLNELGDGRSAEKELRQARMLGRKGRKAHGGAPRVVAAAATLHRGARGNGELESGRQ